MKKLNDGRCSIRKRMDLKYTIHVSIVSIVFFTDLIITLAAANVFVT